MAEKRETSGLDQVYYHSSRKERHESSHIGMEDRNLSFFRRNPSFRIFLIDLVFIAIISGLLVPFIFRREGTASLEGYGLELRAFRFDGEVMASLAVSASGEDAVPGSYMEVLFFLDDSDEGETLTDLSPPLDEERIFRAVFSASDAEYVSCRLTLNGKNKTIKKKIK